MFSILVLVIQLTIIPSLGIAQYVNVFLVLAIVSTLVLGIARTIWWIVGVGALMDYYSLLPFGVTLVSLVVTTLIIENIARHWLTNRATGTFGFLMASATLLYTLLLTLGLYGLYWFSATELRIPLTGRTLEVVGIQIVTNTFLAMLLTSAIKTTQLSSHSFGENV